MKLLQILWKIIGTLFVMRFLFEKDFVELKDCILSKNDKKILNKLQVNLFMYILELVVSFVLADAWLVIIAVYFLVQFAKRYFGEVK